ncbi:hypothetical protein BX666DRAFT_1996701 [Dichotomocladium elegans]|nr:hypothetical protein BX666DRAFT_1996701 [Dichotomocladium elegans]
MQAAQQPQGRGQNAPTAIPLTHQRALIPASFIEFPTQRLYAISAFVLLQAFKLYDVFLVYYAHYPEEYNGILLKWWLVDAMLLLALWILQIPWLQFSFFKTGWLIAFLMGVDVLLFSLPSATISAAFVKALLGDALGKQISASRGQLINVKDVLLNSTHILGRHTVHILPYGTAKLNPNDEYYCLPGDGSTKDVFIPIVLNNTTPRSISVSRYDFETNEHSIIDFSGRDIQRATEVSQGKQGLEYYFIRMQKTGVYKLESITSKDGLDVRLYNRLAYVFRCPSATFLPARRPDYCSGEKDTVQFRVSGVPPLRVEYIREINGRRVVKKMDRIQPEHYSSPLTRMNGGLSKADSTFFTPQYHQVTGFGWGAPVIQTVDADGGAFDEAGDYKYLITKVTDGVGNTVEMSPDSPSITMAKFDVHPEPTVHFECKATDPVKLLIGDDKTKLPLTLEGSSPWELEYEFTPELDGGKTEQRQARIATGVSSLWAHAPGEYKLLRVSDRFCQGNVLFPSTCQVKQPPLPSVEVQATPIPSECAGDSEIGMKFAVELVGTPPYTLEYRIMKQSGKSKVMIDKKRERIDRSRHLFTYLPSSSGEYTYEFTSLDDRNYKNRNTGILPIKQIVHPQPDAKFSGSGSLRPYRTCLGEDLELDVELSGTGPYTLTWTFAKQMYSDVVTGSRHTIKVPRLESAGHHVVSLVKIQDANDCVKDLDARDVIIDVRRDRPKVFFHTGDKSDATLFIAEGESAKLPLRMTGEGPWKVTYRNIDKDGKGIRSLVLRDPNAEVEVKETGTYELLSVEDAICKGDALPPRYTVHWIDKPKISVVEEMVTLGANGIYERPSVCKGVHDAVDIEFEGEGPFYCAYDQYVGTSGRRDRTFLHTEEIRSGSSKTWIGLQTQESGRYQYVFNKVADARYTRPLSLKPPLVVEQTVHAIPTVKFLAKSKYERKVCVGDTFASDEVGPIWIELTGKAPFTVRLGLKHHSEPFGKTLLIENIQSTKYKLDLTSEEVTSPGQYDLQLLTIQDANGCMGEASGSDALLEIDAQDIATIVPAETCAEHCVGDTLDYSLSGIGPFTISYQFNGRNEKVKTQTSRLSLIADKPGNLTIISVGDQRNKCRSFPKDMTKIIHEVPSSLVSGGREIIENIREGEMVQATVDLIGTPPFDFEWQRSEAIWDSSKKRFFKGEVLESHSVHNVEGHRYAINTSVEGIIEVVRIKDAYCHYPRQHL